MLPTYSTDLLRTFETLPGMYLVLSKELNILTASNSYCSAVSKSRSSIIGKYIFDVFPIRKDEAEEIRVDYSLSQVIATSKSHYLPVIRFDNPNAQYWQTSNHPVFNNDGSIYYIIHHVEEVSEQVNAAKSAQLSNRLEKLISEIPARMATLAGPNLVYEYMNSRYATLFEGREILGKPLLEAFPEVVGHPLMDQLRTVYETGVTYEGNEICVPLKQKDGLLIDTYFNLIYQPRYDEYGKINGILSFAYDITELVTARKIREEKEQELLSLNVTLDDKVKSRTEALLLEQQDSEKQRDRFKFLLNAIPQQVWTAKPNGELDYVNEIVCQDFGKSIEDIVGSGWQAFIHPDDLMNCLTLWTEALKKGTEYMVEFRLYFAEGVYKWHLARAVPLIEQGQITLWLGTNTNIEFQKTNEQRKDEFLSIASHELKTPLTSIKAFNQLMIRAKDVKEIQQHIKKSSGNIIKLEKLIDDLLDVTKITAGKMQYNMEKFNFDNMIEDVVGGFKLIASNHELILESNEHSVYRGDHFRLEQVLNNLLNNAVKYSPNGKKIIINSRIQQESLIVSIQDFGIGIAKQNVSKLFERYYRADNIATRFEGLGLGLFIAAEILKRHKGDFWLKSEEGVGSTFYFRLPIYAQNLSPVEDIDYSYRNESISINYNKEYDRLDLNWIGPQTMDTVKYGCLKTFEMILRFKINKILNNNTQVDGSWAEASEWVGAKFFPMMEKKGVHSLAWISSSNVFSQLSAKKSVDVAVGNITTQFFTSFEEAEEWINKR